MTLTQYIEQVREEYWRKFAERFNVSQEQLFNDSADFWEAKIRERESALRGEIEGALTTMKDLYSVQGKLNEQRAIDFALTNVARIFDGGIIQDKR